MTYDPVDSYTCNLHNQQIRVEGEATLAGERVAIRHRVTNIHRREAIYQRSLVSTIATAVIAGLGARGYPVAVRCLAELLGETSYDQR